MGNLRATATRIAGTFLLSAAIFGCDTTNTIVAPDALDEARVTRAEKIAGYTGTGQMLGRMQDVSPLFYEVETIPFQPGPTDLANLGPVCDDCVMNDVPIGFPFTFYGNTYSSLQISSNGFVRFAPPNNDSGCCSGRVIPLNDTWNNIIAFAWTDLNPSGALGGRLRWETLGDAPNRRWVLHADSVRYFGGTETNLIQWLVLHEGSNVIEIHTERMTPRVITQGTENASGTAAHFIPGRVATTFSLTNDGVRFTPEDINDVTIDRAYSGDPPRAPGIINLGDEWVYIEIWNVQQYLGRPASADDVRIGATWETGVPAESFQLLDINSDGNLDIRLRFSRQALQNAGLLTVGQTTLVVWGRDPTTGDLYRGEIEVTVEPAPPPPPPPGICYDNGPFITHPNGGTGPIAGQHVSMAGVEDGISTAGSNVLLQPGGPHFRVADDFTVPAGGWTLTEVVTRAYQTGAASPTWTSANMNIRSGSVTGPIVASTTTSSWTFSGVYRTFNAVLNDANRPIFNVVFDFGGLNLPAGTYWIDWQVVGGASAWAPYVMLPPSTPGGNDTQTVFDNGQQMFNAAGQWQPLLAPPGAETPFLVGCTGGTSIIMPIAPARQAVPVAPQPMRLPAGYSSQATDRGQ